MARLSAVVEQEIGRTDGIAWVHDSLERALLAAHHFLGIPHLRLSLAFDIPTTSHARETRARGKSVL